MKKEIFKNTVHLLVFIVIIFSVSYLLKEIGNLKIQIQKVNAENNKLKIENIELKKPSKIEIQKLELIDLEKKWKEKKLKANELRKKADLLDKEKAKLEPKIRSKRNEILGKK